MKVRDMIPLLSVFLLVFSLAGTGNAVDVTQSDEVQRCLGCHAKQGLSLKLQSGESLSAYVNAEKFKASVHSFLTCSNCHADFSGEKHPERKFRSKEQYRIKASAACRKCHTDAELKAKSIHLSLLKDESAGRPHPCSNCHSAHAIMATGGAKKFSTEGQYCLSCHGYSMSMSLKSGETLSLFFDRSSLGESVHDKLSCSDCHYGFSSEEHPKRNFRSRRDYTIASSENCRRCHFDKYTRALDGMHYIALSQGNLRAPVCIDCHGSHAISRTGRERVATAQRCRQCHSDVYETYAKSVHGKALMDEQNHDVPVCKDCHAAHNIRDPHALEYHEKIPDMCANCHANKNIVAKYGLSTDVVKSYLSDFHGITLGFYKKQREAQAKPARPIAVCSDCHGTHNILSTKGMDAAIVKANLRNRCQNCHQNAPKNFPDTWLSHYEPSLKRAPLVFAINLTYKIFIPVLLIGLLLQILLHIWRYAVNR